MSDDQTIRVWDTKNYNVVLLDYANREIEGGRDDDEEDEESDDSKSESESMSDDS